MGGFHVTPAAELHPMTTASDGDFLKWFAHVPAGYLFGIRDEFPCWESGTKHKTGFFLLAGCP